MEERFERKEADALTLRIIDRLGERQQKLDCMAEWERSAQHRPLRPTLALLAIAACIAAVIIVQSPWQSRSSWEELGLESPVSESFRAATPDLAEINQLIEAKNYDKALAKTEQALAQSDSELSMLSDVAATDEELLYEKEAEQLNNQQLRWTCIYLLVQTERIEAACSQLEIYLQQKDCPHRSEAQKLLKKLK